MSFVSVYRHSLYHMIVQFWIFAKIINDYILLKKFSNNLSKKFKTFMKELKVTKSTFFHCEQCMMQKPCHTCSLVSYQTWMRSIFQVFFSLYPGPSSRESKSSVLSAKNQHEFQAFSKLHFFKIFKFKKIIAIWKSKKSEKFVNNNFSGIFENP